MKYKSSLHTWLPTSERFLIRVDFNVDFIKSSDDTSQEIIDDFRIRSLFPTLDRIQELGAPFTIITHIGRPKNQESDLSTQHLVKALARYNVEFVPDIQQLLELTDKQHTQSNHPFNVLSENFPAKLNIDRPLSDVNKKQTDKPKNYILENLRFFPGETSKDPQEANQFAQQIAKLGPYYVNDAFGALHRHDSSIALVPRYFEPTKRTIGLLVERELATIDTLFLKGSHPKCVILGGNKALEKLETLHTLITKKILTKLDTVLLGPLLSVPMAQALSQPQDITYDVIHDMANTSDNKSNSKSENESSNKSKSENNGRELELCQKITTIALANHVNIQVPIDYQIIDNQICSIGPKTIPLFTEYIMKSKTILTNGCMGFNERPETLTGMAAIFQAIGQSNAHSIVSGGSSVAAIHQLGLTQCVDYLSTGGGATLAYISGEPLPGLIALDNK